MIGRIKNWFQRPRTLVYCGVNHGHTFRQICDQFDCAIGFEPIPELYRRLAQEFAGHRHVEMVHGALAESDGSVTFHIHDFDAASSIGVLSESYKQRHNRHFEIVESVDVPCYHLGNFLHERGIHEIDTLVTDIQGFDLAVLKTLDPWIRNQAIRAIKSEVEQDQIPQSYEDIPGNKEKDFLEFLGDDYELIHRRGEPGWSFNDLTWIRTGETNRKICA